MRAPAVLRGHLAFGLILGFAGVAAADRLDEFESASAKDKFPPRAGVDVVKPVRPDWCADVKAKPGGTQHTSPIRKLIGEISMQRGIEREDLGRVAAIACLQPDDTNTQKWVANWRQAWINQTGISERENRDSMKVYAADWATLSEELAAECAGYGDGRNDSPRDRAYKAAVRDAPCGDGITGSEGFGWWFDRTLEVPSELARAAYLISCFAPRHGSGRDPFQIDRSKLIENYPTCGIDARRGLDRKRFEAEVQKLRSRLGRVRAREMFGFAEVFVREVEAAVKAQIAKDPELEQLLIKLPEAAVAAWQAELQAHQPAIEAAFALEDQFFKDPSQKCGDGPRTAFDAYISARKHAAREDVLASLSTTAGYVLFSAMRVCDAVDRRGARWAYYARFLDDVFGGTNGRLHHLRGPRMAAYWAVFDEIARRSAAGSRDQPIRLATFKAPGSDELTADANGLGHKLNVVFTGEANGIVKSAKPRDGHVQVVFKTELWKEEEMVCSESKKIDRIDSDGTVRYRQDCRGTGKILTHNQTPPPVLVPEQFAKGIAPGVLLESYTIEDNGKLTGYPRLVYKDKTRKQMIGFYGIELR